MSNHTIPDTDALHREILASHERSRQYGIDPLSTCNPRQAKLSSEELASRRKQNIDFFKVATAQMQELYRLVAGAGFIMALVYRDGYILDIIGDRPILEKLKTGNCFPGYRWTEKDVGTSAISLALARRIPVQLNADEHFCKRGHEHTSSSSPVYEADGKFIGVIAMSGEAHQVHPHTLGMVITAAKAIENQLRIAKTSQELLLRNNYMNAIIDSIDSGVIATDRNGIITQANNQGKRILDWEEGLEGKPLSDLFGPQDNWKQAMYDGSGYIDREIFIKGPRKVLQLITTAKPIFDSKERVQGIIFIFHKINRIRRLVNKMAGSQARFTFEDIIGVSSAIQETKKLAILVAAGKSSVLLIGETGTGKELFAQSIHNQSKRRHHPFVAINCGAIPRELLESELFGYVEGAFTGAKKSGRSGKLELADGGTVFLDEIGDMPVDMQVKLLRVLQAGEVSRIGQHQPTSIDLRIIAATHFELKKEVEDGNFREDLFYRLNVFPITIPPLRERPDDIVLLAKHILNRCCQALNKPEVRFSSESEQILGNYHWPGNIRELENVVERAVNLVDGNVIEPELFGALMLGKDKAVLKKHRGALLEEVERQTIMEIIEQTGFNISKASKMLGITRSTLYNRLKKYNLSNGRKNVKL